ncbi:DUF1501 domain-containing protein, partial [Akkermansiaceae bacterium]|nr:DUF1501 domain-containing protein [Akkermansiaceae bacterium]
KQKLQRPSAPKGGISAIGAFLWRPWRGEFGRTPMSQGSVRDRHNKSGSMFMAGGGIKGGISYGETDPFGFTAAKDPFHVHDFHATALHLRGIEHKKLTYKY